MKLIEQRWLLGLRFLELGGRGRLLLNMIRINIFIFNQAQISLRNKKEHLSMKVKPNMSVNYTIFVSRSFNRFAKLKKYENTKKVFRVVSRNSETMFRFVFFLLNFVSSFVPFNLVS